MKTITKILMQLTLITLLVTQLNAQELTVYVLPSPFDRKWESPRELILTTVKNILYPEKYKKHIIGHVFIKLSNDEESYITGSTLARGMDLKSVALVSKKGLGILNSEINGRLEQKDELLHEMAMRYKYGNISFIRFKISPEMYERLTYYLHEYDSREYDTIYNGLNLPRQGKGAGCSAFAVSFLEVAGFLNKEWAEKWQEKVKVPVHLVGGTNQKKKVKAIRVLRSFNWAEQHEPHIETSFYDPNTMHNWITDKISSGQEEARVVQHNKAIGLEYDFSEKKPPLEAVFPTQPDN